MVRSVRFDNVIWVQFRRALSRILFLRARRARFRRRSVLSPEQVLWIGPERLAQQHKRRVVHVLSIFRLPLVHRSFRQRRRCPH